MNKILENTKKYSSFLMLGATGLGSVYMAAKMDLQLINYLTMNEIVPIVGAIAFGKLLYKYNSETNPDFKPSIKKGAFFILGGMAATAIFNATSISAQELGKMFLETFVVYGLLDVAKGIAVSKVEDNYQPEQSRNPHSPSKNKDFIDVESFPINAGKTKESIINIRNKAGKDENVEFKPLNFVK